MHPAPLDQMTSNRLKKVKSRNTSIEKRFRSELHNLGVRFRINNKDVIGQPDVAHRNARVAIFIDGCFWHRHKGCYREPKNNPIYWREKIENNIQRRATVKKQLNEQGWVVLEFWECEILRDCHGAATIAKDVIRKRKTT